MNRSASLCMLAISLFNLPSMAGDEAVRELTPQERYQHGFPGAQWPKLLVQWLNTLPERKTE
jgi:hypothetical protein